MGANYEYRARNEIKNSSLFSRKVFWITIILGLILVFILPGKALIFLPLVVLQVILSWARNRMDVGWLGVELILFNTVLAGMLLGPVGGMVMAGFCVLINYLFSRKYASYFFITLPLYAVIGLVSSFIPITSLVTAGIILVLAYNFLSFSFSMMMGARSFGLIAFTLSNIAFNVLLFSRLGPFLIQLLA